MQAPLRADIERPAAGGRYPLDDLADSFVDGPTQNQIPRLHRRTASQDTAGQHGYADRRNGSVTYGAAVAMVGFWRCDDRAARRALRPRVTGAVLVAIAIWFIWTIEEAISATGRATTRLISCPTRCRCAPASAKSNVTPVISDLASSALHPQIVDGSTMRLPEQGRNRRDQRRSGERRCPADLCSFALPEDVEAES